MSESVSGVDVILTGLQRWSPWSTDPNAMRPGPSGDYVLAADAEAAVHATVREIEAHLRLRAGEMATRSSEIGFRHAADEVARRFGGTPDE